MRIHCKKQKALLQIRLKRERSGREDLGKIYFAKSNKNETE